MVAFLGPLMGVDLVAGAIGMGDDEGLRERTAGNGVNVVSAGLSGICQLYDGAVNGVTNVRNTVGKGIHDVVSSVPLVGPILGGVTDAAGGVVDFVGAGVSMVGSEGRSMIEDVQSASNTIFGNAFGAAPVDIAHDYKTMDQGYSALECWADGGLISAPISGVIDGVGQAVGGSTLDSVTEIAFSEESLQLYGGNPTQAFFSSAVDNGLVSQEQVSEIHAMQAAGKIDENHYDFMAMRMLSGDNMQNIISGMKDGSAYTPEAMADLADYQSGKSDLMAAVQGDFSQINTQTAAGKAASAAIGAGGSLSDSVKATGAAGLLQSMDSMGSRLNARMESFLGKDFSGDDEISQVLEDNSAALSDEAQGQHIKEYLKATEALTTPASASARRNIDISQIKTAEGFSVAQMGY